MDPSNPRVTLKKGSLQVDGAEVDKFEPVQTLFFNPGLNETILCKICFCNIIGLMYMLISEFIKKMAL